MGNCFKVRKNLSKLIQGYFQMTVVNRNLSFRGKKKNKTIYAQNHLKCFI